jgi:hypothetical protein
VKTIRLLAVSALALAAASGFAMAQDSLEGKVFAFHSPPRGACPSLDWHLVAESNGKLTGMISWNAMQDMAKAAGSYNMQSRTFKLDAKEVGGQGRTATVSGTIRQDGWLVANISGPNVKCEQVAVPFLAGPAMGGNG